MGTLTAVSRWLTKRHVITRYIQQEKELWCASAFYLFDAQRVVLHILTKEKTRHVQMSGPQAVAAGTVNGQSRTVVLICGVRFKGEIRRSEDKESDLTHKAYNRYFLVARMLPAPVWEIRFNEIKFTNNMLGFGKKIIQLHDSGTEQTRRFAVKRWQITRCLVGNQLIFVDHNFLIIKFRTRTFNTNNDRFNCGQLAPLDHTGTDQQLRAVTDDKHRFAIIHETTGEDDKTVASTQITR